VNKAANHYRGQALDLTLYTIEADRRCRYVANIYSLECIDHEEAEAALDVYRRQGWLDTMRKEIIAAGGNPESLGDTLWVENLLNVRFRVNKVDFFPPNSFAASDDQWLKDRHRYQLYDFTVTDVERVETQLRGRRGTNVPPLIHPIFRRSVGSIICDPLHRKMQTVLLAELQQEYGTENVLLEEEFIDVTVRTGTEKKLYEIKSDLDPRNVIREALGQILEYAYHPLRKHELPIKLVIVGRVALDSHDLNYLEYLKTKHSLPLEYKVISV